MPDNQNSHSDVDYIVKAFVYLLHIGLDIPLLFQVGTGFSVTTGNCYAQNTEDVSRNLYRYKYINMYR